MAQRRSQPTLIFQRETCTPGPLITQIMGSSVGMGVHSPAPPTAMDSGRSRSLEEEVPGRGVGTVLRLQREGPTLGLRDQPAGELTGSRVPGAEAHACGAQSTVPCPMLSACFFPAPVPFSLWLVFRGRRRGRVDTMEQQRDQGIRST